MSGDYYAIVGVDSSATQKDISKAFRAKARKLHPDKQPPGASEAQQLKAKKAFQELALAYEVLSDETKRADYNLSCPVPSSNANHGTGTQAHARANPQTGRGNTAARSGPWYGESEYEDWDFRQNRDDQTRQEETEKKQKAGLGEQHGHAFGGLGSHWVKPGPPPKATGWSGWKQSGGESKKRSADDDSDVSSTLSFNIDINLQDLDLQDLEMYEVSGMAPAEVWTFESHDDVPGNSSGAQDASANIPERNSRTKQKQPSCCTVS